MLKINNFFLHALLTDDALTVILAKPEHTEILISYRLLWKIENNHRLRVRVMWSLRVRTIHGG